MLDKIVFSDFLAFEGVIVAAWYYVPGCFSMLVDVFGDNFRSH